MGKWLKCSRKSALRRGTDTGASWKFQVYTLDPEPQENQRGIMGEPLHIIGEPSTVRRPTPSIGQRLGTREHRYRGTEVDQKLTIGQNVLQEDESELQKSSGAVARGGEPAGWT